MGNGSDSRSGIHSSRHIAAFVTGITESRDLGHGPPMLNEAELKRKTEDEDRVDECHVSMGHKDPTHISVTRAYFESSHARDDRSP